jgi:hypothetical protein
MNGVEVKENLKGHFYPVNQAQNHSERGFRKNSSSGIHPHNVNYLS